MPEPQHAEPAMIRRLLLDWRRRRGFCGRGFVLSTRNKIGCDAIVRGNVPTLREVVGRRTGRRQLLLMTEEVVWLHYAPAAQVPVWMARPEAQQRHGRE